MITTTNLLTFRTKNGTILTGSIIFFTMKSKKLKELRENEQAEIRKLYNTGEYSMRDLRDRFRRSLQYIYNAIHAVDKKDWQVEHYLVQCKHKPTELRLRTPATIAHTYWLRLGGYEWWKKSFII